MDFSLCTYKKPSLVENPSIVGDLALTKKIHHWGVPVYILKNEISSQVLLSGMGWPKMLSRRRANAIQTYTIQEAKESFASPYYLFYGKSHIVKQLYRKNGCKKPFLFAFNTTTRGNESKWNPAQIDALTTLYLPRSYLSGLIQRVGRYLATTKGCQTRYFKDRQL